MMVSVAATPVTSARLRSDLPLMLVAVASMLLAVLYASDAPWICDEPLLIQNALAANAAGELATQGLMGTQGVQYGPLPTWLYQAYLGLSHDMVLLVQVRAFLFIAVIALSLWCIARFTRLSWWGVPLLLFSPSIWLYSRLIWDNTLCIPLSILAVASYLLFLHGRRWAAGVTLVVCGALVLVHLMSIPLIAGMALHALCFYRRKLWQSRWQLLWGSAATVLAGYKYWPVLIRGLAARQAFQLPGRQAALFSFGGGQWISGMHLGYFVGDDWLAGAPMLLRVTLFLGVAVHALVVGGMLLAAWRVFQVLRRRQPASPLFHLSFLCLAVLLIQFIYLGSRGAVDQPHYYNASWFVYGLFAWQALDRLARFRVGRHINVGLVTLPALTVALLLLQLHQTHGTRSMRYGPTLGDQIVVARAFGCRGPETRVFNEVPSIDQFPQRIFVLEELQTGARQAKASPSQAILIHYASPDPRDGAIVAQLLVEAGRAASAPSLSAAATQSAPTTR